MLRRMTAIAILTTLVSAAPVCGSDKAPGGAITPKASEPTASEPTTSAQAADAIAASARSFEEARSFRLTFRIETVGLEGAFTGDAAFHDGEPIYGGMEYVDGWLPDEDIRKFVFLPPDLFVQQSNGDWFVQSPWNQGIRPDQDPGLEWTEPFIDYYSFATELDDITDLGEDELEDATARHLSATIRLNDIENLAPEPGYGDVMADVDVWLSPTTDLPQRVEIETRGRDALLLSLDFTSFGEAPAAPEAPIGARPYRDLGALDAPCTGPLLQECLQAQPGIVGEPSCSGTGRRVCILPIGAVSPQLIAHVADYYRLSCGLDLTVLAPVSIPPVAVNMQREQVDAVALIEHAGSLYPADYANPEVVFVGLTPVDVYDSTSHYRYVFGVKGYFDEPQAILSTFRMDPLSYGLPEDEDLRNTRLRKMLSKYLGLLFYDLPTSGDPSSPMYDSIGGVVDLDAMTEPLPVCQ